MWGTFQSKSVCSFIKTIVEYSLLGSLTYDDICVCFILYKCTKSSITRQNGLISIISNVNLFNCKYNIGYHDLKRTSRVT